MMYTVTKETIGTEYVQTPHLYHHLSPSAVPVLRQSRPSYPPTPIVNNFIYLIYPSYSLPTLAPVFHIHIQHLVVNSGLAVVTNELHTANHLTDGEEAKHLRDHDTSGSQLGGVHVADAAKNGLWCSVGALLGSLSKESRGVAEALDEALKV